MAILLGTMAEVQDSGGRRSVNAAVLIPGLALLFQGVTGFSKQGIYTPLVCWLAAAAAKRYRISLLQIGMVTVFLLFTNYYLVPYSQYGRSLVQDTDTFQQRLVINEFLLTHLPQVRNAYLNQTITEIAEDRVSHYYDKPSGIFDRLQMIAPDDELVDVTENGAVYGYLPTLIQFENVIPHFILPNKPASNFGNIYAHELGMDEEDVTTGISFSPSGEAFHQGKWVGIFVLLPALLCMMFLTLDSICGDLRTTPLGIGIVVSFLHIAPEGGTGGLIGTGVTGAGMVILTGVIVAYILPLATNLLIGPPRGNFGGGAGSGLLAHPMASAASRSLPGE